MGARKKRRTRVEEVEQEEITIASQQEAEEQEKPFSGVWIGLGALLLIVLLALLEILFF